VPLTVVVLSSRLPGVVPAAALPVLRSAADVVADASVPGDVRDALGAVTGPAPADGVLLTCNPAVTGDTVITTPEPAGSGLLDAVVVMDRLRSPGGCPWDAEQTHASLLQYLVEECYELYDAIESGDRPALREELGDVLLQVLFHARVAAEAGDGLDIDAVASELVTKLVGRHPHVFAGPGIDAERIETAERQEHRWEELKRAEKRRESSVDGVPLGQPAVALAAKLTSRTARAGFPADLLPDGSGVGERLFALAAAAKLAGVDPEAELRAAALRFAEDVRAAEKAATATGADPHTLDEDAWRAHWTGR
jgi:XTP/dITP diphosphohydrolase